MKAFFYIIFLLSAFIAHSQKTVDVGKNDADATRLFYVVAGEPVSIAKYVRVVDGSPYFNDSWMKGSLITVEGHSYDSLILRLDLVGNTVEYIGPDGREMAATTPLKSITLTDSITGNQYFFIHSSFLQSTSRIEAGWYQVLASGAATMYKRVVKSVQENKPYGSATTEQTIRTSGQYFLLSNSDFSRVKKITDLPGLLINKKAELSVYIDAHNLSGKTDADYVALISYYNSLLKN